MGFLRSKRRDRLKELEGLGDSIDLLNRCNTRQGVEMSLIEYQLRKAWIIEKDRNGFTDNDIMALRRDRLEYVYAMLEEAQRQNEIMMDYLNRLELILNKAH